MTLQEAKDQIAIQHGFPSWSNWEDESWVVVGTRRIHSDFQDEVAELYARNYAEDQYGGKLRDEQLQNTHLQSQLDDLRTTLQFAEQNAIELQFERDELDEHYKKAIEHMNHLKTENERLKALMKGNGSGISLITHRQE